MCAPTGRISVNLPKTPLTLQDVALTRRSCSTLEAGRREFGIFFPSGEAQCACTHQEHALLDFQGPCLVWEGEV